MPIRPKLIQAKQALRDDKHQAHTLNWVAVEELKTNYQDTDTDTEQGAMFHLISCLLFHLCNVLSLLRQHGMKVDEGRITT